jgi:hypothetical protein
METKLKLECYDCCDDSNTFDTFALFKKHVESEHQNHKLIQDTVKYAPYFLRSADRMALLRLGLVTESKHVVASKKWFPEYISICYDSIKDGQHQHLLDIGFDSDCDDDDDDDKFYAGEITPITLDLFQGFSCWEVASEVATILYLAKYPDDQNKAILLSTLRHCFHLKTPKKAKPPRKRQKISQL